MKAPIWIMFLCFAFTATTPATAGVTVIQEISFGSFVVKNNDAQHTITINPGGTYSFSPAGFLEILPPQQGIYDIDGLPVSTAITSVTVTQHQPLAGSGENFQIIDFQEVHPATTDGTGVARIRIGATAQSSGNGNPYADQTLNGKIDIQVNF